MNKYFLFPALLTISALIWQACGQKEASKQQMPGQGEIVLPVSTVPVGRRMVSGTKSYPGSVVPLQETEIRAEVSGYITEIYVSDGASVAAGDVLYEIDGIRYQAALDQAKATVEIARANLERSEKDLARYESLAEMDAIAKQTLDYAKTDVNNQKAQLQAAKAALVSAETNLERSVIRAPFSGMVGISQVRNGALVSPGATLLNTISSVDPVAVEFQVAEREIPEFLAYRAGKTHAHIDVVLPDGMPYGGSGRISTLDRAVDPTTGTLKVRATFRNTGNTLRAGMNLTINVISGSETEQLVIPIKAVRDQLGSYNVFVVNDSSRVEQQLVELGMKVDDQVVVKSGLAEGQKIVMDGIMNMRSGVKVVEKQD